MGKPKQPKAPDPYQTAGADFAYNNLSQFTPYGNLTITPPSFTNTGTAKRPFYTQNMAGSATLNLSPEIQSLLDKQLRVSGITLDQALSRQGELSNLGALPSPDRGVYEKALFDRARGLLDPVFSEQERALRDRLSNQGLPTTSEAYGFDTGKFLEQRNRSYERAALEASLGAGDYMGQEISNAAALRSIPFNEIASLLGIQQVQPPQLQNFYSPRGADFTGAQALQTQTELQNYGAGQGVFGNLLQGLFGLGSAAIQRYSDRRLKQNIRYLATINGNRWYLFDYIWGEPSIGVMADEVDQSAVSYVNGFAVVDYGAI